MTRIEPQDIREDFDKVQAGKKNWAQDPDSSGRAPIFFVKTESDYRCMGFDAYLIAGLMQLTPQFKVMQSADEVAMPIIDISTVMIMDVLKEISVSMEIEFAFFSGESPFTYGPEAEGTLHIPKNPMNA